ncbi:MAG: MFS transporter [Bdellovibrionota bacterium]
MKSRIVAMPYAAPSMVLAPMAVTFYVFIPKLYADLGTIPLSTLGVIVSATRLWDAFIDPAVGKLSDRTSTRFGPRKPWMLGAALPLCACFLAFFFAEHLPGQYHASWFAALSIAFFSFWAMFTIPYDALGQELETAYDERSRLFALRDGATLVGTLLAAIVPAAALSFRSATSAWTLWLWIAATYTVFFLTLSTWCVVSTPVIVRPRAQRNSEKSAKKRVQDCFRNEHFRLLIVAYAIASFGGALPASLFLFYVEHILKSDQGTAFLALYFIAGIVTLPFWVHAAKRIGKKRAWLTALLLNAGGFLGVAFLSAGASGAYSALIAVSGIGYGASVVLPSAMQADVLDAEELRVGERRDGEMLGLWSLAKKTSAAIGTGLALWLLGRAGFQPNQTEQTESALRVLRLLYCVVPCLCTFASVVLIRRYSLSKEAHTNNLALLAVQRQQRFTKVPSCL